VELGSQATKGWRMAEGYQQIPCTFQVDTSSCALDARVALMSGITLGINGLGTTTTLYPGFEDWTE